MTIALRPPSSTVALAAARAGVRDSMLASDADILAALVESIRLSPGERSAITARAEAWVTDLRRSPPAPMDLFFASFGLATPEGRALMGLAEALLRVPDRATADLLIADTLDAADWGAPRPVSRLVRLGIRSLGLAARWLDPAAPAPLHLTQPGIRPIVRMAARQAMRALGGQFVLGETIAAALHRSRRDRAAGITHSFDMLGEAARTDADAEAYFRAYATAIAALADAPRRADWRDNPGISVKLSALHPRYEETQAEHVLPVLIDRVTDLARRARAADLGFTIDAEEADRLELSLDVAEAVLADPALDGWNGFGFVVQAYSKRAPAMIDWLAALAGKTGRRIAVRLVKGAYWDMEVKRAQTLGLAGFPVFTDKAATDVNYLACARRLLDRRDALFPQLATHNAHTIAAILAMAGQERDDFELQRLHGMGEALHAHVRRAEGTRLRVYAPVGPHRELLAYLVRRMLENGANASFVNQVADAAVPPAHVVADPIALIETRSSGRGLSPPPGGPKRSLWSAPTERRRDRSGRPCRLAPAGAGSVRVRRDDLGRHADPGAAGRRSRTDPDHRQPGTARRPAGDDDRCHPGRCRTGDRRGRGGTRLAGPIGRQPGGVSPHGSGSLRGQPR